MDGTVDGNAISEQHEAGKLGAMQETARWTKREVAQGGVLGGEKVHGYTPDGSVLCGALGDEGSDPFPYGGRCNEPDDDLDFDPESPRSCKQCSASYKKLPELAVIA